MTEFGEVGVPLSGAGIVGENLLIEDYSLDEFNHDETHRSCTGAILAWLTFRSPDLPFADHAAGAVRATGRLSLADRERRQAPWPRENAARAPDFRGIGRIGGNLPIQPGTCRLVPDHCENGSSPFENHTHPTLPTYCASKHTVIGPTRNGAKAYAREDIWINAICPERIEAEILKAVETDADPQDATKARAAVVAAIPAGRCGEPEEVAVLSALRAGNDAKFINGSIYTIDGTLMPFQLTRPEKRGHRDGSQPKGNECRCNGRYTRNRTRNRRATCRRRL